MSSRKRKLLAALISSVASLLALEVVLRIAGHAPMEAALGGKGQVLRTVADPLLRYDLTPSTEGEGWGTYVVINTHGFRDREYDLEKGGALRVCVIGDSITFGNHLALEETYPEVLERSLAEHGTTEPVEVLNLGVGGYDTVQQIAMLERTGLSFDPDLVIVGFCVNDLGIVSVTMEHSWSESDRENPLYLSRLAQSVRAFLDERKRRRETAGWNSDDVYAKAFADQIVSIEEDEGLKERMVRLRAELLEARHGETDGEELARRIPPRWYASPARVGRFAFALDRLRALADREGFQPALLIVPYLAVEPAYAHAYEIVRYMAASRDIQVLEVEEEFTELGLAGLRIDPQDPVHPDARGHAILARRLFDFVGSLGWLQAQ